ncbi:hypothetical protein SEA_TRACKER_83 [Gordonia phage Tracker]|nr:hypothetical protein SEA_TRACKER_83 [Gordonia phage Tracker]
MAHTLTPAQRDRMSALPDSPVTSTVSSAHSLAAAVANDDFHGALSNVVRSVAVVLALSTGELTADDVERMARRVSVASYGTDDADRARLAGELFAIADYMRTYGYDNGLPVDGLDDERCVACGEPVDYCAGHGEIGDPVGRAILDAHDDGDHNNCHPLGCDDAPRSYWYRFNRPMEREHYVGDLDGLAYHVARLLTVRTVRLLDDGRMVDAGCGMTVGEYGEL